jgi:hypothetical protein
MTRRAVVTQAQIERGLRAAKAAMPEQPWRIRITPAEVTIEPAEMTKTERRQFAIDFTHEGQRPPQLDEGEDVVL